MTREEAVELIRLVESTGHLPEWERVDRVRKEVGRADLVQDLMDERDEHSREASWLWRENEELREALDEWQRRLNGLTIEQLEQLLAAERSTK